MSDLTPRDRELVALGAAMGSNCVPCVEYHIAESRKAGLSDPEIHEAIQHADRIRQVPARKTLQAALKVLPSAATDGQTGTSEGVRGVATDDAKVEASKTAQPRDMMIGMMSAMRDACGSHGQSASPRNSAEKKPAVNPTTSDGCGCG